MNPATKLDLPGIASGSTEAMCSDSGKKKKKEHNNNFLDAYIRISRQPCLCCHY